MSLIDLICSTSVKYVTVVGRSTVLRLRKVPNSYCGEGAKLFGLDFRCVTA